MPSLDMVKDGHLGGCVKGGDPATWFPNLWSWVVREFAIESVLDVGCGEGYSTQFFHELGCRAIGLEGSREAIANSPVPSSLVQHDFCKGAYEPDEPIDMVWSCEFVEHIEAEHAENVLRTFSHARKFILLTHAFPGSEKHGHHHVNCRYNSYWIRRIEPLGFVCDRELSVQARKIALPEFHGVNHFARSGLVFRKVSNGTPALTRTIEANSGMLSGLATELRARANAWAIKRRFQGSPLFCEHYRKYRTEKRARKRALRRSRR